MFAPMLRKEKICSLEMGFSHELLDLPCRLVLTPLTVRSPANRLSLFSATLCDGEVSRSFFQRGGFLPHIKIFGRGLQRGPRGVCFRGQSVKYCPISQQRGVGGCGGAYNRKTFVDSLKMSPINHLSFLI